MDKNIVREPSGILVADKHAGVTSHDIVGIVRRAFGTRRVGHTGTLDPMATGVLVVLIGRAAKASEYLACDSKRYVATLRLGLTTDTEDITGNILTESTDIPSPSVVAEAAARFRGKIMQTPPMFSALKVGGRKLYDIARAGGTVERASRPVEIFSLYCTPAYGGQTGSVTDTVHHGPTTDYVLDVTCSSGTYIRTLCADIGASLGCGGVMASLRRLEAGGFGIEQAVTAESLLALQPAEREALLLPVESLFRDLPAISLPAFYEKLCRSGCEIYLSKLRINLTSGQRVRLLDANEHFFALGEVGEYPGGEAVKAIKTFEL